jgi:xanthine dehydrogenase small subunit
MAIRFTLNDEVVEVEPRGSRETLLEALRGDLGVTSAKDGCAPQGQCGCCTVLVDGRARVACVTPLRRVAGRSVVTLEGLDKEVAATWAEAFAGHGASQCGFCTPGIIMRLEDRRRRRADETGQAPGSGSGGDLRAEVERALGAHLCRCTGWQGICEAACHVLDMPGGSGGSGSPVEQLPHGAPVAIEVRPDEARVRATLEGGHSQRMDPVVVLGGGGFAADTAPGHALVAMRAADGGWVVAESLPEVRESAARVQGRRSTLGAVPPLELPEGEWVATLRTSWVEPGYLETDASWCEPGGEPADPLANGGAFGGKLDSPLPGVARRLADAHDRAVLAIWTREDTVRCGPKRPPVAAGMASDGTGTMRVAAASEEFEAMRQAIQLAAPGLEARPVELPGPPTSPGLRAAGWAEAFCLCVAAGVDSPLGGVDGDAVALELPSGARARVRVVPGDPERDGAAATPGTIEVDVQAGDVLSEPVLRSYVVGAVHMAAGWVTSEGLAVDADGEVQDLTIRSFGILPVSGLPHVSVSADGSGEPVAVSDAVFVAAAAAIWRHHGFAGSWPLGTPVI